MLLLMTNSHSSTYQIVMRLGKTERIWRRSIVWSDEVLVEALRVRTSRSLLCCSGTHSVIIRLRTQTTLTSFVALRLMVVLTRHSFSVAHHLSRAWLHRVILIHFIVKGSSSDGTTSLEDAKLLLVKDLRVGKALISRWLTKLWRAHYLLRHH